MPRDGLRPSLTLVQAVYRYIRTIGSIYTELYERYVKNNSSKTEGSITKRPAPSGAGNMYALFVSLSYCLSSH